MKKLLLTLLLTTLLLPLLLQLPVASATYSLPSEYKPDNVAESWGEQNLGEIEEYGGNYGSTAVNLILGDLISGLLAVIGVVAVLILVTNGLKYATSFGQQEKIDQAKKGIMWALAGLMVVLISYSVVRFAIRIIIEVDQDNIESVTTEEEPTSYLDLPDIYTI